MRRSQGRLALLSAVAAVALTLSACGDDGSPEGDSGGSSGDDKSYSTTQASDLPASPTLSKIQDRGTLVVGTKFDQPLFGQKNPASNEIEGFDAEIGRLLALYLLGGEDKVEFVETVSKNREAFIREGKVDTVIATYTINDARKLLIGFAGPYYIAGQAIMVKADNDDIESVQDLDGKKVSTVQGSTSEKNLKLQAPGAEVVLFDTYTRAAEALNDDRVEAESTDNVILLGLIDKYGSDVFKLAGGDDYTFTEEPYGMGVPRSDTAFRNIVNDFLEEIGENGDWQKAYDQTIGTVSTTTPEPPPVDRY